jgi:predicted AlkP superfamily pyrophosphatase or phosphodiesterase
MKVLVISFDAVSDKDFLKMAEFCPNIAEFIRGSHLQTEVKTVFVSNTYPVHTSVSTGLLPAQHGIITNVEHGAWVTDSRKIGAKTIWEAAGEKKLTTAAILWPVTGHAKITYNLPEIHILRNQNQLIENLRAGSPFFQLKEFLRHGRKLHGIAQPGLDDFVTAVSEDVIREKQPDLALVHFTIYDDAFHHHGLDGDYLREASKHLDHNLGRLLAAAGDDTKIIVFSDHGQLPVVGVIDPNEILIERKIPGYFKLCGGSAFYIPQGYEIEAMQRNSDVNNYFDPYISDDEFIAGHREMKEDLTKERWFKRFLTEDEMEESGMTRISSFGVAAKPGWCFGYVGEAYRGNHGYPTDYQDYRVFYAVKDPLSTQKTVVATRGTGGHITDVTKIIVNSLNLQMP